MSNTTTNIGRTFAFGDIHGCYAQLVRMFEFIKPTLDDTFVFLGDYIDRGDKSKDVLNFIIDLKEKHNVIVLLGNHEAMMREAFNKEHDHETRIKCANMWYKNGGFATLCSYTFNINDLFDENFNNMTMPDDIQRHLELINEMPLYHMTDKHIFTHASPLLNIPIEDQDEIYLTWRKSKKADKHFDFEHLSGKTIVCGHTAQKSGVPLELSRKNIIIDSGCVWTGWLTAMNIDNGGFIQANKTKIRLLTRK